MSRWYVNCPRRFVTSSNRRDSSRCTHRLAFSRSTRGALLPHWSNRVWLASRTVAALPPESGALAGSSRGGSRPGRPSPRAARTARDPATESHRHEPIRTRSSTRTDRLFLDCWHAAVAHVKSHTCTPSHTLNRTQIVTCTVRLQPQAGYARKQLSPPHPPPPPELRSSRNSRSHRNACSFRVSNTPCTRARGQLSLVEHLTDPDDLASGDDWPDDFANLTDALPAEVPSGTRVYGL